MGVLRVGLCPGLTQEMIQLLRSRRIKTVVDLVSADLEEVAQKCGLSYKALVALRRVLLAQFSAFPLNGADLYEELKTSTAILSTGIGSLDKLLDAGLYTGEVTEIVGGPGSGKTQVCLCVAANVAHGLQQNILYVDSNGGLTASRLLQLLQTKTQDEEEQAEALQRIQVVHAFDIFQMLDVLQELRGTVAQQSSLKSVIHTNGTRETLLLMTFCDARAACCIWGDWFFRNYEGGGGGLGHCGGLPTSGRSAEGRLGLDDAAGPRAEDPGPGPWHGSGGDQPHNSRQGQREAKTCPWTLLELCAQHSDSPGHHRGSRSISWPAHGVSHQISPTANRFPGDGRHWDLGDLRAERHITG
ncbi:DNA repair protein RAD51 homolog 4 isoform X1 [Papio anubis]|uniref:DNA repair protein RAD51 homolog 4 isoform X1 n=1 Tax=Papio anubis TaxID=9555 RepID=UPI0012AE90DC|nr:DNA repair protein RAD51 homolog 4 isoform X1 [Papio anubis]